MVNRKFKIFETLEKFRKLYEAAEQENPEEAAQEPTDAAQTPQEGEAANPADATQAAEPQVTTDPQKAMYAKMMLDALMAEPPAPGTIPDEWLQSPNDHVDEIIKQIQGINALETSLSLQNEYDPNSIAGGLKDN
jgi:hypothetical protein